MSDQPESQDPSDKSADDNFDYPEITPLQELAYQMSEVYDSLVIAGVPAQVGAWIIASMMSDAMDSVLGGDESGVEVTLEEGDEEFPTE